MKLYCVEYKDGVQLYAKDSNKKAYCVGYIVLKEFFECWRFQKEMPEIPEGYKTAKTKNEYAPIFCLEKAKDTIRKCNEMFLAYYLDRIEYLEFRPNSMHEVTEEEQIHINTLIKWYSFKFADDNTEAFESSRTPELNKQWFDTMFEVQNEMIKLGYMK